MRKTLLFILFVSIVSCSNEDDPVQESNNELRYFRFSACDHTDDWRNESFVAATSNQVVINQCLQQLSLPIDQRTLFPLGKIEEGSGGYNFNDTFEFNWHFVENDWVLVEMGIEIYDGCPYSEAELLDYVGTVGRYGGWGNRVDEEVFID